jgi:hypothetical protein
VALTFRHNAFTVGEAMADYKLRRKEIAPTPGSYEYWNGTIWTTEGWVALAAADQEEVTVSTGTWTADKTYEWGAATRNGSAEGSDWSEPFLLFTSALPSLTLSIPATVTDSRPKINWLFSGGTGRTQREVTLSVYTNAETTKTGFDPADENFNVTWRSSTIVSGTVSQATVGVDLVTGESWKSYYHVVDDAGLSSGWVAGPAFSTSYAAPTAPSIVVTPNTALGYVTVEMDSSFNLLDSETSSFLTNTGEWSVTNNAMISHDGAEQAMRVLFTGQSYGLLDAAYATYTAEDTAFANYAAVEASRTQTYTELRTDKNGVASSGVPVVPSTTHSAVVSIKPLSSQISCALSIMWYNSGGTYLSAGAGSTIICSPGVYTNVYVDSVTSNASAAYGVMRILFYDPGNVIGEEALVKNAALADSSTVTWTPGGDNTGIAFVLQRKVDNGDWEDVHGATDAEPVGATGQGQDKATVEDKTVPLQCDSLQYRAYAISEAFTDPKYSLPVVSTPISLLCNKWFLRDLENGYDLQLLAGSLSRGINTQTEVVLPLGGSSAIVFSKNMAPDETLTVGGLLLSTAERAMFEAMIRGRTTLFLQRNVGDSFFLRPTGEVSLRQISSAGQNYPTETNRISFNCQVVS